jgi:hypothetical protein
MLCLLIFPIFLSASCPFARCTPNEGRSWSSNEVPGAPPAAGPQWHNEKGELAPVGLLWGGGVWWTCRPRGLGRRGRRGQLRRRRRRERKCIRRRDGVPRPKRWARARRVERELLCRRHGRIRGLRFVRRFGCLRILGRICRRLGHRRGRQLRHRRCRRLGLLCFFRDALVRVVCQRNGLRRFRGIDRDAARMQLSSSEPLCALQRWRGRVRSLRPSERHVRSRNLSALNASGLHAGRAVPARIRMRERGRTRRHLLDFVPVRPNRSSAVRG